MQQWQAWHEHYKPKPVAGPAGPTVLTACGNSFEQAAITAWLADGNSVSPVANQPLSHEQLLPNHALPSIISALPNAGVIVAPA